MKFVVYEGDVSFVRRKKPKLLGYLEEFMNMNVKVVRVNFDRSEYKNASSAQASLALAIKRYALPMFATVRKDELYLVRTDM